MRIALEATPLIDMTTGVARYTRELGRALESSGEDVRRFAIALRGATPPEVQKRWRAPARLIRESWRVFGHPRLDRIVGEVDLIHGTNFVLPPTRSTPGAVTVHDLSFFRNDVFPGGERLRELVPWSIERAAMTIVPTHAIAREAQERFGVADDRLAVTPEGVSPMFFGATPLADAALEQWGITHPYVLTVGTIEPRKNLQRLLEAWRAAALSDWKLVIAGPRGWGPELPETPGVIPVGYVGDETLPGLLAGASLFCYVSLYEGFGLPPLEAMAAGTPTLVSRTAASEEVVAEAAHLVDPTDVDSISHGLLKLAESEELRRELSVTGRARASGFSWARTALATQNAYRAILA